jgi:hypothetical protein
MANHPGVIVEAKPVLSEFEGCPPAQQSEAPHPGYSQFALVWLES